MKESLESDQCSICQKGGGKCICGGCRNYFCVKHFDEHRKELSKRFDDDIVRTHDEFVEQINKISGRDCTASKLLEEIDRWETLALNKVHQAAERAREQLIQVVAHEKSKLKNDFERITKEIHDRLGELNFDENDIENLRQRLNEMQLSLSELIQPTGKKTIIVMNDRFDWNQLIYVGMKIDSFGELIVIQNFIE